MPSDDRAQQALEALAGARDDYRSAVARAVDEVRSLLRERGGVAREERDAGAGLGAFAAGRIDPRRFASLVAPAEVLDPTAEERLEAALSTLEGIDASEDGLFRVRLDPEEDLHGRVGRALARTGTAFGAARVAEMARVGQYREELHGDYLDAFGPRMWNRSERRIAPPLVVELDGRDLRAGGLADYLDGGQKLVLVPRGDVPPAALVRLITPGQLVLQTGDPAELERLADFPGSAVAAVHPQGARAASFLHDPRGGDTLPERLSVGDLPDEAEIRPVGPMTREQQVEELRQLVALARAGSGVAPVAGDGAAPTAEGEDVEPADRLAAWLLRQASLDDVAP
jgi:hypothetical protein